MDDGVKWLKFNVDFLDGASFKLMRHAEVKGVVNFRDKLEAVWWELVGLAGKVNNSGFFHNDEVSFSSTEDLASMIDREPKELEVCLAWYEEHKMITIIDGSPCLTNFCKYQSDDALTKIRKSGAERAKAYRERQKLVAIEASSKQSVTRNVTDNVTVTGYCSQESKELKKETKNEEDLSVPYKSVKPSYTRLNPPHVGVWSDYLIEKNFLTEIDTAPEDLAFYDKLCNWLISEYGMKNVKMSVRYFVSCYVEPVYVDGSISSYKVKDGIEDKYKLFKSAITTNCEKFKNGYEPNLPDWCFEQFQTNGEGGINNVD